MAPRAVALLIEDDARLGALMKEYLGEREIDVTVAGDGERGLAVLGKERFDAVLLDIMLPGGRRARGVSPHPRHARACAHRRHHARGEDGPPVDPTADASLLHRALWNLVENSAKYGAAPITLSAACLGDRVVLVVSDLGNGIAEADRERVSAPFYRGDTGRGDTHGDVRRGGVGLGLTLARRIAQRG